MTDPCQQTKHKMIGDKGDVILRNEDGCVCVRVCVWHWMEMKVMGRKVRLVWSGFVPHLNSLMVLPQRQRADTEAGSSLTAGGANTSGRTGAGEFCAHTHTPPTSRQEGQIGDNNSKGKNVHQYLKL